MELKSSLNHGTQPDLNGYYDVGYGAAALSDLKTFLCIGSPYRHEVLETPLKTRKKAVTWSGDHGFLDHSKPLKEDKQVFYPTPPKTVLPNPKLREWNLSLSERTCNMLKNLERANWVTSYQMHYTDFLSLQREKSFPVFVPSKPRQGCRRREEESVERSNCSPTTDELPDTGTASATVNQHRPQKIIAKHNEAPDSNQRAHSQSKYSSGSTETNVDELPREVSHKQQTDSKSFAYEGRERGNCKVQFQFDESPMQVSVSQSSQEANAALIANTERPLDLCNRPLSHGVMEANEEKSLTDLCVKNEPCSKQDYFQAGRNVSSLSQSAVAKDLAGTESHAEILSRAASGQDGLAMGRELAGSISNPCILPRPTVLPGIHSMNRVGTVGRECAALSLMDLQNSFSKSMAHRRFNSSITHAAVNLRDNAVTGKKH
ncbi:protein C7orf31-like protein, partial [Nibea albiflora]